MSESKTQRIINYTIKWVYQLFQFIYVLEQKICSNNQRQR